MKKLKLYTDLYNEICCAYEDSYWNAQSDLAKETKVFRKALQNIADTTRDLKTKEKLSRRCCLLNDMFEIQNHIPVCEGVCPNNTLLFITQVADVKGYELAMKALKTQLVTHIIAIEDLADYTTDENTQRLLLGVIAKLYKSTK